MADHLNWWTMANCGEADANDPPIDWWQQALRSEVPCETTLDWSVRAGEAGVMNTAALLTKITP